MLNDTNTPEYNINIQQHIYRNSLNDSALFQNPKDSDYITNNDLHKMYNNRYDGYPPMNGLGHNPFVNGNLQGYTTNTYNEQVPHVSLNQHNVNGTNDIRFSDGFIPPNTMCDQNNFSGHNSISCGSPQNDPMYMQPGYGPPAPLGNNFQPNYRMNGNYNPMYPYKNGDGGYYTRTADRYPGNRYQHCTNKAFIVKSSGDNRKIQDRKMTDRKNFSKLKKGGIDINIETSAGGRQGITLDLNIDV